MDDDKILDIFYKKLVPEAITGKIDCYFTINMVFDLVVEGRVLSRSNNLNYDGILIPTLNISNRHLFDKLLIEYVNKAISFYDETNFRFLSDIDMLHISNVNKIKEEYLIKYIICTLFANASFSDFDDPVNFLKIRIAMFDNRLLCEDGLIDFGYFHTIGARLFIEEKISPIRAETPYRIVGYLEFDDGYKLLLPEIYVGMYDDKYYLYGIQKMAESNVLEEREYLKKIRKGMIAKINGAPEHYFLAVMLLLTLCKDKEVIAIPFLVERWNAKRMSLIDKAKRDNDMSINKLKEKQDRIQENITNTFIRYFTKLSDVTDGLEIGLTPFDVDSSLHISVSGEINSRSVLFNELFAKTTDYKKTLKR